MSGGGLGSVEASGLTSLPLFGQSIETGLPSAGQPMSWSDRDGDDYIERHRLFTLSANLTDNQDDAG